MRDSVAPVMQGGARLPSVSQVQCETSPKRGRQQEGGTGKPLAGSPSTPLEAEVRSCLCSGCAGGQLGFVSVFVGGCKLSVPCLLDQERKTFLSVFWKL